MDDPVRLVNIRNRYFRSPTLVIGQNYVFALETSPQRTATYRLQRRFAMSGFDRLG